MRAALRAVNPAATLGPDGRRVDGRRRWVLGALLAQAFLVSAYVAILTSGGIAWVVAAAFVDLLAFSGVYVFVVGRLMFAPLGRRIAVIAVLLALSLPQFVLLGPDAAALWIFVAVAGGLLFAPRVALALAVVLAGAMLAIDVLAGHPPTWELALTLIALTAFMVGFGGNVRLNIALRETREQLAVAAVAAERERIGRDLHDILGHSLTAIAVKSGLARRLIDRDPAAAAAEIADVETLVRQALADVRATASGFRDVSLASELAVAASVLRAAGIQPVLPASLDEVDPSLHELFGFVVKEAVTNVVRHSGATTCTITVGRNRVEVRDDGTGTGRPATPAGNGLHGLRARVAAVGGTVVAGPLGEGGFGVRVEVPLGVAPAPAPAPAPARAVGAL